MAFGLLVLTLRARSGVAIVAWGYVVYKNVNETDRAGKRWLHPSDTAAGRGRRAARHFEDVSSRMVLLKSSRGTRSFSESR
jgi:hypothetical protein